MVGVGMVGVGRGEGGDSGRGGGEGGGREGGREGMERGLKAAQSASYPAAGKHRSRTRRLNTVDFFLYTQKHENANRYAAETRSPEEHRHRWDKRPIDAICEGENKKKKRREG